MSRHTSFVLGYHGCEREVGEAAISGKKPLKHSTAAYHWLGRGIYFWENDADRALDWAIRRPGARKLKEPFVVGAIIDRQNCLDLRVSENVALVKRAYVLFKDEAEKAGMEMPVNQTAPLDSSPDKVIRRLDHAVIARLHNMVEQAGSAPFDTVCALFDEGVEMYEGSGFKEKTHSEIAVINEACILGYFLPRPYPTTLPAFTPSP